MCEELQHVEMLPGIFDEDNDGKCTLLSNTRSQSDVKFDTYRQRQGALNWRVLFAKFYVYTNLFRILLKLILGQNHWYVCPGFMLLKVASCRELC
jgi:hypothetical protein